MSRKYVVILSLLVVLSSLLYVRFNPVKVKAPIGYPVHNIDTGLNYTTIQGAIDAPETLNGHTILIENGTYHEHVLVNKALRIVGENKYATIIDGNKTGTVFLVTTSNIGISNLTIQNCGHTSEGSCVELKDVSGCKILNNIMKSTEYDHYILGIAISDSSYLNSISNNFMEGRNIEGIRFGGSSSSNTFSINTLVNSSIYVSGYRNNVLNNIFIGGPEYYYYNPISVTGTANFIGNNHISYANRAIQIDNGTNVTISGNVITGYENLFASAYALVLREHSKYCFITNNTIADVYVGIVDDYLSHANKFVGNTIKNTTYGICITVAHNNASNNTLLKNTYGIYLGIGGWGSDYNTLFHNTLIDNDYGIYVDHGGSKNNITSNKLLNNNYGILLIDAYSNIIDNNYLDNNNYGIHCVSDPYINWNDLNAISHNTVTNGGYGVYLTEGTNTIIFGNTITNNLHDGVHMSDSYFNDIQSNTLTENNNGIHIADCHDNNFTDNTAMNNNGDGVHLKDSHHNIFSNNNVTNNHGSGIWLLRSSNSSVFHNFFENAYQVYTVESTNCWDDGYPSGGNYWSDYNGTDLFNGQHQNETGSDGIGDTPYIIDENNIDEYPLMNPFVVTIPGDIDGNHKVDYKDLFILARAYGCTIGDPCYVRNADLDFNGKIDYKDLFILARNYGKKET